MVFQEVESISNAAVKKEGLLQEHRGKYMIRAIMAGVFVALAMVLNTVSNHIFFQSNPAAGKVVGALYFSVAVLLIVLVGGELYTGNNFVMGFASYDHRVKWKKTVQIWIVSWIGNLIGAIGFALLFVAAGVSGSDAYIRSFMHGKIYIPYNEMFFRAILCNFMVCLAVLCGMKIKSDVGKIVMIIILISGFTISGFEHSVADMGIYTLSAVFTPEIPIGKLLLNLIIVSVGNMVGGTLLLALPIRKMSLDK